MYIAQTNDSLHSLVPVHDDGDNTITVSVFNGVFPGVALAPVQQFKFNEREATDLINGLTEARDQVKEAADAAHARP